MRREGQDGFTLIEALAALAVTAAGLAAIGQLGFTTVGAAHRAETRLALTAVARKLFVGSPAGEGAAEGEIDGFPWRRQAAPFAFEAPGAPRPAWTPQAVRLILRSATGGELVVDTVRLRPESAPR